jgi:hypothetical protein
VGGELLHRQRRTRAGWMNPFHEFPGPLPPRPPVDPMLARRAGFRASQPEPPPVSDPGRPKPQLLPMDHKAAKAIRERQAQRKRMEKQSRKRNRGK